MADAIADKVEKPDAQEIMEAVQDYKRFYKQNRKQEVFEITTDELITSVAQSSSEDISIKSMIRVVRGQQKQIGSQK